MYESALLNGTCYVIRYNVFLFPIPDSYYIYGLTCLVHSILTFLMFVGVTASGLFSQSLVTSRIKPPTICRAKTSPDLSQSLSNDIQDLSNESYSDTIGNRQEKIEIRETDNKIITYSGDKSYSQSEVMTVMERGTVHAFTVAVALSVHSVFEGLAFGLQDSINDVRI